MASVRKKRLASGRTTWQAVWRTPAAADGTRRQKTANFSRAADARAFAAKMEEQSERRGVGDHERHDLARFLVRWHKGLVERGELSPSTLENYRKAIDVLSGELGHIELAKLSAEAIDRAYGNLLSTGRTRRSGSTRAVRPLAPRSVAQLHKILSVALRQARKWRMVPENVAADARPPTAPRATVKAFSEDEIARLFTAASGNPELLAMLSVLATTGMRRSELLGLCFSDLDAEAKTLAIARSVIEVAHGPLLREATKTASSARVLAVPQAVIELLLQQRVRVSEARLAWGAGWDRQYDFLFPAPGGGPQSPGTLTFRLRRLMLKAGVSGRPPTHGFRHAAATVMLHSGVNVVTAAARLGHSSPATTLSIYSHPIEAADIAAGEVLGRLLRPPSKP